MHKQQVRKVTPMKYRKEVVMSESKRRKFALNAKALAYYREHPCIACEELLGIKLIDAQKIILQSSWNTPNCLWVCTRDFGKSFELCRTLRPFGYRKGFTKR